MSAELKVGIGVDASGLDTGLDQAGKQVEQFGKTVQTHTKKVGASFTGMSRVLQDAAFGPGAIANNLQGLGEDFKQLSQAAKDSGQSIGKTLVQSLAGPGGLNLAMGGLTLGLSLASFGLQAWTRIFGESNKEVKKGTDGIKEYVDSLETVNKASAQGAVNAQKELSHLQALFHVYQDANLPLEKRKEAYKALQDQYPDYFANIRFENEASDKLKGSYDKLTQSILATAQARAAEELIAGIDKEMLVNRLKLANIQEKQPALIKKAADEQNNLNQINELGNTIGTSQFGITQGNTQETLKHANAVHAVADSFGSANALTNRNNVLNSEKSRLLGFINEQVAKGADLTETANQKSKTENETIKDKIKLQKDFMKSLGVKGPTLTAPTIKIPQELLDFNKTLRDKVVTPIIEIGPILRQGFFDAFAGIGEAIGTALATGGNFIEAFGQSVLSSMGSILIEFGKLTIAAGVASLGLAEALKNPFGGGGALAIAAGVALVAIGSAVKAFSGSLGGSSSGGGGGSSTSAPSAVPRGFQASAPSGFALAVGSGASQFQFTLKGADLVASIDRTRSLNSRQGAR